MSDQQRRQELADFLRTRRMRLSPEQVGLIRGGRRRTPGLRREEVAELAHVGVSWYTLLEQGRDIHPSGEVLQSIADALQLTPGERQHLFLLGDQTLPFDPATTSDAEEQVSPALHRVLDGLNPFPAYIIGRRWNFLAWNTTADHVLLLSRSTPPYEHNAAWRMFADPIIRHLYDWEEVAQRVLAEVRADSVRYADDPWFKRLIDDLQHVSPEFRTWWARHDVRERSEAIKEIHHPSLGYLAFEHTTLQVPAQPDLKVMIYTPLPTTDTLQKLQQLMDQDVAVSTA
jgi:transcriptional regulator with XRE-family HTH domain